MMVGHSYRWFVTPITWGWIWPFTKAGDQLETSREAQVPEEAGLAGFLLVLGSESGGETKRPLVILPVFVSLSVGREKEILMGLSVFREMAIAEKSRSSW